jgi:hypothetical protein
VIKFIDNIFTQKELEILNNKLNYSKVPLDENNNYVSYKSNDEGVGVHQELGRLQFGGLENLSKEIKDKVNNIATNLFDKEVSFNHAMGVEYKACYGTPNLPVHYDLDDNDLIINFQLLSNTQWGIGVDLEVYNLQDNSAVIFNGNEHTHWRPHKIFKDDEFVKMIFFRFKNYENTSDYSHLDHITCLKAFKEINKFRESYR